MNKSSSINTKRNYISIAKAIGIVLMVVGHSGCPQAVSRFIYIFHMPLFFVCSGLFFKEITEKNKLIKFYHKKIHGLYLPYLKWSLLFLILHNSFRYLHITGSRIYTAEDYLNGLVRLLTMTDYELLIRPFWFLKELLLASLCVANISFLHSHFLTQIKTIHLLLLSLALSIFAKFLPPIPLIGDSSVVFLSIAYFYTGILISQYKEYFHTGTTLLVITTMIVTFGSILFVGKIDMRFTTASNTIPYYLLSLTGVIMIFVLSKRIERIKGTSALYYIGNNTMPILAMNLLALKAGSLIKIWIYGMPFDYLESYTVIYDNNTWFWLLYTIVGITIPLFLDFIYAHYRSLLKTFFLKHFEI